MADLIHIEELKVQLQHVRGRRFRKSELVWLAGNTFYGTRGIFEPAFLEWLEHDFQLSDYQLRVSDGQIHLTFEGSWAETTMWELYALAILDELKTRAQLKTLSEFGLDILYARAKTKLWNKIERLRGVPGLSVADFGTRRRHSFLWQEYVVVAMAANLGSNFIGTSNAFLAHKHDLEAIGTNAHEIPMVMAALAPDDVALKAFAISRARTVAADLRRRAAGHAAGHVWNHAVSDRRAGLGRDLDRAARGQQGSVYCRGRIYYVAEGSREEIRGRNC